MSSLAEDAYDLTYDSIKCAYWIIDNLWWSITTTYQPSRSAYQPSPGLSVYLANNYISSSQSSIAFPCLQSRKRSQQLACKSPVAPVGNSDYDRNILHILCNFISPSFQSQSSPCPGQRCPITITFELSNQLLNACDNFWLSSFVVFP